MLRVELMIDGVVLGTPMEASATLKDGKLDRLWGSASCEKPLTSHLDELASKLGDNGVATTLRGILGNTPQGIKLDSLSLGYFNQGEKKEVAQIASTLAVDGIRCHFMAIKKIGGGYVAGLSLETDGPLKINFLKDLIGDVAIEELGVHYASEKCRGLPFYPPARLRSSRPSNLDLLEPVERDFPQGWKVSADISIANVRLLDLDKIGKTSDATEPASEKPAPTAPTPQATAAGLPSAADTFHWFEVDKTIGPLSVRRLGMRYQSGRVELKFDAGLGVSCLTLALEGMGLSYPLDKLTTDTTEIWNNLQFSLDGASVAFARGPIVISGGLLKTSDSPLQLDGTLQIKTGVFCLSALGSYANLNGTPSFLVFASLNKALGGPPEFFVTGIAFGFGVNRNLKLPTIDEVHSFPLVKAATDPAYLGKDKDLRAISGKLAGHMAPSPGNYWIAAGVKFTSYGLIDSFALLSVSFGNRLEIALLGLSRIRIPNVPPEVSDIPAIACIELALRVVFAPDSGLVSCEGRLTENTFILHKDFKLRGGFALYSWFAGPHAGDFAVSLGGYHRKFKPPPHYPTPDRVELDCRIDDAVSIRGHCYFALCPSAIMAGGGLNIAYDAGGIKAWFVAYADFLVQWKPLSYDVAIGVIVGVAARVGGDLLRINLAAEVSATVALYGPPLGGEARISLSVISFTVRFGTAKTLPTPLVWDDKDEERSFVKSFLPNKGTDIVRVSVAEGQLRETDPPAPGKKKIPPVPVSPHRLVVRCDTAIPVTSISPPQVSIPAVALGVRPIGATSFRSHLEITVSGSGKPVWDRLELSPVIRSVPMALWSNEPLDTKNPPAQHTIDKVCMGLEIRTQAGTPSWSSPVIKLAALACEPIPLQPTNRERPGPKQALEAGSGQTRSISTNVLNPDVVARRSAIVNLLRATNPDLVDADSIELDELERNAPYLFQVTPLMAHVGQYPPRNPLAI